MSNLAFSVPGPRWGYDSRGSHIWEAPMTTVVVFGGTGFLGRRLVRILAAEGASVCVAVRHPPEDETILAAAAHERVSFVRADIGDPASVAAVVAGAEAVVNAVSLYVEKGGVTFAAVHEQGAETVARASVAAGVPRLVLVSGMGADPASPYSYIRARGRGERAVQQVFPGATIVRPSAMFGPGDALFAGLADIARLAPALPLIGGGRTRLQPVYVEDVATAIARMLADPGTTGRTFELGGPAIYTLRELTGMTLRLSGRRRPLIPMPFALADILARLLELLPSPPLTTGQVDILRADNIAGGVLPGFAALGIQPRAVEAVVPTYIRRSRPA